VKDFLETLVISLKFILATSLLILLYGLVTQRAVDFRLLFNANFFVGASTIFVGIIVLFIPPRFSKLDKLTDHSTFVQRHAEAREQKQKKAYGFILLGILVIVISSLIQFAFIRLNLFDNTGAYSTMPDIIVTSTPASLHFSAILFMPKESLDICPATMMFPIF